MIEPQISARSQTHKLKMRLQSAGITHGESARVDLSDVAVRRETEGPRVYFCEIGPIQVLERLEEGDGGPLPEETELVDLAFPKKGHYHLENAIVRTNGRMRLEADEKTRVKNAGGLLARAKRFFGHLFGPPVPPGPGRGL